MRKEILQVMEYAGLVAEQFKVKLRINLDYENNMIGFKWVKDDGMVVALMVLNMYEVTHMRVLKGYKDIMIRKVWQGLQ